MLQEINAAEKNVITIEDPIEYHLEGISQIQVNNKKGLTFATGLRSLMRQDPDIMMVGEIRDEETARIATQAALTGHLVFSTLHTNDAAGAVARMLNFGVEPYLVASSVLVVIAQRLIRLICEDRKAEYEPEDEELKEIGRAVRKSQRNSWPAWAANTSGHRYLSRTATTRSQINEAIRELITGPRHRSSNRRYRTAQDPAHGWRAESPKARPRSRKSRA